MMIITLRDIFIWACLSLFIYFFYASITHIQKKHIASKRVEVEKPNWGIVLFGLFIFAIINCYGNI
jgi:hypothetical protein